MKYQNPAQLFCVFMNPREGFTAFVRVTKLRESLQKKLRMTALRSHRVKQVPGKDIQRVPNLLKKWISKLIDWLDQRMRAQHPLVSPRLTPSPFSPHNLYAPFAAVCSFFHSFSKV